MPGPVGALHVAVRLPQRTAEPCGELPRGVRGRHIRIKQVCGGVDPLREHITAGTTTASRAANRHDTNVLLNMSRLLGDTPRPLDSPVPQRDLEAEVANCVGGVVSPLLANIYLHRLDRAWEVREHGVLVRYADDLVVMCRSRQQAEAALARLRRLLADLGLEPKAAKTRIVHLEVGGGGFDFLGFHHRLVQSQGRVGTKGVTFLARWPSKRAVQHARDRLRDLTARRRLLHSVEWMVEDLNRFLRGWAAYFRYGNSADQFDKINRYARMRMAIFVAKRHRRSRRFGWYVVAFASSNQLGLIDLTRQGTIAAPRPYRAWRVTPNAGGQRRR